LLDPRPKMSAMFMFVCRLNEASPIAEDMSDAGMSNSSSTLCSEKTPTHIFFHISMSDV